jgi:hypothetical protein
MDEARLAEIEECVCYEGRWCCEYHPELIAEIRRLRAALDDREQS